MTMNDMPVRQPLVPESPDVMETGMDHDVARCGAAPGGTTQTRERQLTSRCADRATGRWSPRRLGLARIWKQIPRMRMLLVDDNQVNIAVARLMLERLGYRVETAANGQEAIDAVAGSDYAAILMDCEMPVLDGYAATAEIRQRFPGSHVPIIAMTANITEIDRQRCIDAGMDDFVSKPILMDVLRTVIARWVPESDG